MVGSEKFKFVDVLKLPKNRLEGRWSCTRATRCNSTACQLVHCIFTMPFSRQSRLPIPFLFSKFAWQQSIRSLHVFDLSQIWLDLLSMGLKHFYKLTLRSVIWKNRLLAGLNQHNQLKSLCLHHFYWTLLFSKSQLCPAIALPFWKHSKAPPNNLIGTWAPFRPASEKPISFDFWLGLFSPTESVARSPLFLA